MGSLGRPVPPATPVATQAVKPHEAAAQ
jgi:hypothetical protein